jgi:hypothetical protein
VKRCGGSVNAALLSREEQLSGSELTLSHTCLLSCGRFQFDAKVRACSPAVFTGTKFKLVCR